MLLVPKNILEAKNQSFDGHKITFGQYFTGGRRDCMASAGGARSTCADTFIYCVRAVCRGFGQSVHQLDGLHYRTSLISSDSIRRLLRRNVVLRSAPLGRPSRSNRQSPHPTLTLRRRKAHILAPRMWDATCSYGSRGSGYARQFRVLPYATSRYTSSFSERQCCTQVTTSDN